MKRSAPAWWATRATWECANDCLDLGFLDAEDAGGLAESPTRSRIFSTRSGSGDILGGVLAPRLEPGGTPDLSHRGVADPVLGGQVRVDQCVASQGALSSVSNTMASTRSSPMVRVRPLDPGRETPVQPIFSWRLNLPGHWAAPASRGDYCLAAVYDDESAVRIVVAETGIERLRPCGLRPWERASIQLAWPPDYCSASIW
jgi:hypothetical protein